MPLIQAKSNALALSSAQPAQIIQKQTRANTDDELVRSWLNGFKGTSTQDSRTRTEYAKDIADFRAFIGDASFQTLTIDDLHDYQAHLASVLVSYPNRPNQAPKPLATRTRNRKLSAVKSLLTYGQKTGYLAFNVGAACKLEKVANDITQRIVSEETVTRIYALEPNPRNRMFCKLAYASGGRVSELCGLKWHDCIETNTGGTISLFGKGGKSRLVPLPAGVWSELMGLRGDAADDAAVFPSRRSDGAQAGHITKVQAWRIVKAAAKRAGVEDAFSPHKFRHAHASHSIRRGASPVLVQHTLGHANLNTTMIYAHVNANESSANFLAVA